MPRSGDQPRYRLARTRHHVILITQGSAKFAQVEHEFREEAEKKANANMISSSIKTTPLSMH